MSPASTDPDGDTAQAWRAGNAQVLDLGMDWLRARLQACIAAQRRSAPAGAIAGSGAAAGALSDVAADWLLRRVDTAPDVGASTAAGLRYAAAREALADSGRACALDLLSGIFGLVGFDLDVLLLALAPRLDARIAALYGYVHDRVDIDHATRHLVELLLCPTTADRRVAGERLSPDGPLRRHGLIVVDGADALSPLRLDERMGGFIEGHDASDVRVAGLMQPVQRRVAPPGLRERASGLTRAIVDSGRAVAQITGPRRSGQHAVAQAVCADFGFDAMQIDVFALPAAAADRRPLFALMARESALSRLGLVIDTRPSTEGADDGAGHTANQVARELVSAGKALVLVLSVDPLPGLGDAPLLRLAPLTRAERLWSWRELLAAPGADDDLLEALVDHFPFGLGRMAAVAANLPPDTPLDRQVVWNACRERGSGRLGALARRVDATRGWDDLVLPAGLLGDLHAIADQVARRGLVYGGWGYDALLPRGRGVSALFAGPSGVGKTLAAEVIARELGLDLYSVDIAATVSKYIGETEKNLARIFDAAEEAGAVLFIDEADALFGKRTEVKDSHDRYANIEISYLLQRIEQHSGLVILATNLRNHVDAGFLRRLRYMIDFPFPDFAGRRALWRKAFPPRAPIDDIDFDALAALEIAGGNITVIAVNAAFLGAADRGVITMRHVRQAARAEFRKLDRPFEASMSEPPARGGGRA